MLLCRVELIEFVPTLQFTEQHLHFPPTPVERRYITGQELRSREVRDVEVVVVGVLIADADDTEPFRIP